MKVSRVDEILLGYSESNSHNRIPQVKKNLLSHILAEMPQSHMLSSTQSNMDKLMSVGYNTAISDCITKIKEIFDADPR